MKIIALKDTIEISSYNSEITVKFIIPAKVEKPGEVVIMGRTLSLYLNKMYEADIIIEATKNNFNIKNVPGAEELFDVDIPCADDKAWVDIANCAAPVFTMPTGILASNVSKAVKASSFVDFQKPILKGALFSISKKHLIVVGSDSHRMCVRKVEHTGANVPEESAYVISASTLRILTRIINLNCTKTTPIDISFKKDKQGRGEQAYFSVANDFLVIAAVIGEEDEFPPYANFKISSASVDVVCNKKFAEEVFERITLFIENRMTEPVSLVVDKNNSIFSVGPTILGSAEEAVKNNRVISLNENIPTGINALYLSDAFSIVSGKNIRIKIVGEEGQRRGYLYFTEEEEDYDNFYLVAPFSR